MSADDTKRENGGVAESQPDGGENEIKKLPKNRSYDIAPAMRSQRNRSPVLATEISHLREKSNLLPDEVDAGASGTEEVLPNEEKVAEFFRYNMEHKNRGLFVIFNHKEFTLKTLRQRDGTDVDKRNLYQTARELGFTTSTHDNLTVDELLKLVEDYAQVDYSDCDCFACAVLTHGEEGDFLYAKDGKYSIKQLLKPFRCCRTLIGKPKLFFVQACRGTKLDHGNVVSDQVDAGGFGEMEQDDCVSIPVEADFFIGYSTVEGYYAWRNGEYGSFFVRALCCCLKRYSGTMELMQIMTKVNRMVACDFESCVDDPAYHRKKQMPSFVTRLTREVYFQKPNEAMEVETTDGIFSKLTRAVSDTRKTRNGGALLLEKQMVKAELELAKAKRKKAEMELKVQELRQKILEHKMEVA